MTLYRVHLDDSGYYELLNYSNGWTKVDIAPFTLLSMNQAKIWHLGDEDGYAYYVVAD